jgi:hypothetical protein
VLLLFSSGVGERQQKRRAAWLFGSGPEALRWGGSEEVAVCPQHVLSEHGGELSRRAKIWAARPICPDGSSHGMGGGIWRFLRSLVPAALRLDCLLPLMSLWHGGE